MSAFVDRWIIEKIVNEPNRRQTEEAFGKALGTKPIRQEETFQGTETFDELGNPIFADDFNYKQTDIPGTGLLADIYDPENQARFAKTMMGTPGGQTLGISMMNQIQSGGQTLDKMDYENLRQDGIVEQTRAILHGAPVRQPNSRIPTMRGRQPVIPNLAASAGLSYPTQGNVPVQNAPVRGAPTQPNANVKREEEYRAKRSMLESLALQPGMTKSLEPMIKALDVEYGMGPGAANSIQEYNFAKSQGFAGTYEDWKKMTRQTIMEGKPTSVSDLNNLMFPQGSPGFEQYGARIPYGLDNATLAELGAVTRDEMTGEMGGKLQLLRTAQAEFPTIEKSLFSEPGVFDNKKLWEMVALDFSDLNSFWASPESQDAMVGFEIGKQAITRVETGAAMPDTELDNTAKRFVPKPWSSNQTNMLRWRAYQHFINNAEKLIDPIRANVPEADRAAVATKNVNDAATKVLRDFGVTDDEMEMPEELKPIIKKAEKQGIQYQEHDSNYIYGVDEDGRKVRINR